MIKAIIAIDDKRGFAAGGKIPWNIHTDGKYFRDSVRPGSVVMGRTTYEQIGEPLADGDNLVVSNTLDSVRPGYTLVRSVTEALQRAHDDIWIIGGQQIYVETLPVCDELYITHVAGDFNCDRIFPAYNDVFELAWRGPDAVENGYRYYMARYSKKPAA